QRLSRFQRNSREQAPLHSSSSARFAPLSPQASACRNQDAQRPEAGWDSRPARDLATGPRPSHPSIAFVRVRSLGASERFALACTVPPFFPSRTSSSASLRGTHSAGYLLRPHLER